MASAFAGQVPEGQYTSTVYGYIKDKKYEEVVRLLSVELQNFPRSRAALSLLGHCYYMMQDFHNAVLVRAGNTDRACVMVGCEVEVDGRQVGGRSAALALQAGWPGQGSRGAKGREGYCGPGTAAWAGIAAIDMVDGGAAWRTVSHPLPTARTTLGCLPPCLPPCAAQPMSTYSLVLPPPASAPPLLPH